MVGDAPARDRARRRSAVVTVPIPPIISVDDHVVEPPELFERRLLAAYRDRAPHVVASGWEWDFTRKGWPFRMASGGPLADWWVYEDVELFELVEALP